MNLKGKLEGIINKTTGQKQIAFDLIGSVSNCLQEEANYTGRPQSITIDMSSVAINTDSNNSIRVDGDENEVSYEQLMGQSQRDLIEEIQRLNRELTDSLKREIMLQGKIIMLYEKGFVEMIAYPKRQE